MLFAHADIYHIMSNYQLCRRKREMNNDAHLESGHERFTGIVYSTNTGLLTNTQNEFSRQWLYNTPYAMDQPVRNREHVRLLLASIDDNLAWVTFHIPDTHIFTQAVWWEEGICAAEVNTPDGGWAKSILHDVSHEINDINSDNFGNAEMLNASGAFSYAETFMLCSLWMDRQMIPEGYTFGTIES